MTIVRCSAGEHERCAIQNPLKSARLVQSCIRFAQSLTSVSPCSAKVHFEPAYNRRGIPRMAGLWGSRLSGVTMRLLVVGGPGF